MTLYAYVCAGCGANAEIEAPFGDPPNGPPCSSCARPMGRDYRSVQSNMGKGTTRTRVVDGKKVTQTDDKGGTITNYEHGSGRKDLRVNPAPIVDPSQVYTPAMENA